MVARSCLLLVVCYVLRALVRDCNDQDTIQCCAELCWDAATVCREYRCVLLLCCVSDDADVFVVNS